MQAADTHLTWLRSAAATALETPLGARDDGERKAVLAQSRVYGQNLLHARRPGRLLVSLE